MTSTTDPPKARARRHDLDAVRSFAMSLGVVLHACLSLSFVPWPITDEVRTEGMTALFAFIHGFRMPLFFLLSGYFAVMLWQRRGAGGLLGHRLRRVLLPMVVACFTILPVMHLCAGVGVALRYAPELAAEANDAPAGPEDAPPETEAVREEEVSDLWAAARAGDVDAIRRFVEEGADVSGRDLLQLTPLHWAATADHAAACDLLVDLGADLEARDGSKGTPLMSAAFWASPGASEALLARGADAGARNQDGASPADLSRWPWGEDREGLTRFVAGLIRYDPDLATMPDRVRRTAEVFSDVPVEGGEGEGLLAGLARFDVGHLWFLWYLMALVALGLPVFAAGRLLGSLPTAVVSPLALLVLVPITATLQAWMIETGLTLFGPSTSSVLALDPLVLGYYAVFFLFGAAVRGLDPDTRSLTRAWPLMLAAGVALFLTAGDAAGAVLGTDLQLVVPALMQGAFAWTMTLGLIGLSARLFQRERAWVRYLSDASYWIYLAHMPLVFLLQGAVARWPLPAWQKLGIMVTTCLALLLVSYALLVRPTPIGWMLNGRRPARGA